MTLTDTQLVLLSAAAQHEEHLITPPATLKGRAVQNALASGGALPRELTGRTRYRAWDIV